jgi:hypothetical protein
MAGRVLHRLLGLYKNSAEGRIRSPVWGRPLGSPLYPQQLQLGLNQSRSGSLGDSRVSDTRGVAKSAYLSRASARGGAEELDGRR